MFLWIPAIAGVLLTFIPALYLARRSTERGTAPWGDALERLAGPLLRNSVELAAAVAIACVVIAMPAAWLTARTDIPGRRAWVMLLSLPLAIPSYVYAVAVVAALGPRGMLQEWLEPFGVTRLPEIYGFWGAAGTLTAVAFPYLYLVLHAAFTTLDTAQEEASRTLGHGAMSTFLRVTLPPLRPALAAGVLLIVFYVLSDFGAVTALRFNTFTYAIFLQYQSSFDRTGAAVLAIMLGCVSLLVLAAELAVRAMAKGSISTSQRRAPNRVRLGPWRWAGLGFLGTVISISLVMPVGVLVYWVVAGVRADTEFPDLLTPLRHSAVMAASGAAVTVVVALPIALLAARYGGWAARAIEQGSYLTHALPGLVIALSLVFFGIRYGRDLYQTLWMLILAYVILFVPNALGTLRGPFLRQPPNLEEAGASLGRRPARVLAAITLPLARPGIAASYMLVFLTTLKELPATLLLSPPGYETLPGIIWAASNTGSIASAALPALVLVAMAGLTIGILAWRGGIEGGVE